MCCNVVALNVTIYVVQEVLYWTQGWETDGPDSPTCVQYGPNFIWKISRMLICQLWLFLCKCQLGIPQQWAHAPPVNVRLSNHPNSFDFQVSDGSGQKQRHSKSSGHSALSVIKEKLHYLDNLYSLIASLAARALRKWIFTHKSIRNNKGRCPWPLPASMIQ